MGGGLLCVREGVCVGERGGGVCVCVCVCVCGGFVCVVGLCVWWVVCVCASAPLMIRLIIFLLALDRQKHR